MNNQVPALAPGGSPDPNQHIYSFLQYYAHLADPPGYAVLIEGPPGIGKTHLVKCFLDCTFGGRRKDVAYISLFGSKNIEQIDVALHAQERPFATAGKAEAEGQAANTFACQELERQALESKAPLLYVFDDLERCDIPINEMLGYINQLIEHGGCKVVLLGSEREMKQKEVYRALRGKVVGKTLQLQLAFHGALQWCASRLEGTEFRDFLLGQEAEIARLYDSSGINNLRVLQQTIWDFQRLYEAGSEEHRRSVPAMAALLRTFFPISFEFKEGRLVAENLLGGYSEEPWKEIRDRYIGVQLLDDLISADVLERLLARGQVPAEAIRARLDSSHYFAFRQAEPSWQTVWYFYERTDERFIAALADMEGRFAQRKYTLPGEILHVFALRLWLASEQLIPITGGQVKEQCVAYVDDLRASARLVPASSRSDMEDMRDSYGGLTYYRNDTQHFQELARYLSKQRTVVLKAYLREQAKGLLCVLKDNYVQFASRVGNPQGEEGENFYSLPVLAAMAPASFVGILSNLAPHQQRYVLRALADRYAQRDVAWDLPDEIDWLRSVKRLMEDATGRPTLAQKRRNKFAEWHIVPILKDFPAFGARASPVAAGPSQDKSHLVLVKQPPPPE